MKSIVIYIESYLVFIYNKSYRDLIFNEEIFNLLLYTNLIAIS